jgi:dynein heavy chain
LSEYHDLNELQKDFEPFNKMWDLAIEFDMEKQEWLNGPFLKISYSVTEKKIETYLKTTSKLIKQFTELEEERTSISLLIYINL